MQRARQNDPDAPGDGLASKRRLREELHAARRRRTETEREQARAAVREHVLARVGAAGWRCVAGYVPLRTEPGSLELLDGLAARGVRVLVPITLPDRDLDWAGWTAGSAGTPLGPAAIAQAEAVLVPASAVTAGGVRLGRGGGSYDRALARVAPGTALAALVFDDEVLPALPRDPWDVPVTAYVRPAGWTDSRVTSPGEPAAAGGFATHRVG